MGCDVHVYAERKTAAGWERLPVEVPDDRDYESFAKMAGVRNRFDWTPISEPRGLPEDTSIKDSEDIEYGQPGYTYLGDHSFSWLTLAELLAVDWNEIQVKSGLVEKDQASFVKQYNREPHSYCQGSSREHEMERVAWRRPLYAMTRTLPEILLCLLPFAEGKPENVRIVFGFDN